MNLIFAEPFPIFTESLNCDFKDEYIQGFFINFNCNPSENLDYFYVVLSQGGNVFFQDNIEDISYYKIITTQKTPLGEIKIEVFALDKSLKTKYVEWSTIFLIEHTDEMIWAELVAPNSQSYYVIPDFLKEYRISFMSFLFLITSLSLLGFGIIMIFYNKIYPKETELNISEK